MFTHEEVSSFHKLDITILVLTLNEELHIERCLKNAIQIANQVLVIDCHSTDRTKDICTTYGVEVIDHDWPGNQAEQFNWALDNCEIKTQWVLRLDADEYLTPELIEELKVKLPTLPDDVSAVVFPLGRAFRGTVLKHGIVNGVKMIRLFRFGKARYETRLMDEHLTVLEGRTVTFDNKFIDDNLISIKDFITKHNNYSDREAALLLDAEYNLSPIDEDKPSLAIEVAAKRAQKAKYAKMPLYWRSIGYFFYRYILKLGFLDGRAGFEWDFFQGLWYRMLVDAKVNEAKRTCGSDREKMKEYIKSVLKVEM